MIMEFFYGPGLGGADSKMACVLYSWLPLVSVRAVVVVGCNLWLRLAPRPPANLGQIDILLVALHHNSVLAHALT